MMVKSFYILLFIIAILNWIKQECALQSLEIQPFGFCAGLMGLSSTSIAGRRGF